MVQIFEHLQLVAHGTTATIADLGRQTVRSLLARHDAVPAAAAPQPPPVASATVRYVPQTHHSLRGDVLRFWDQHGGGTRLGAPLTGMFAATNGEGSDRRYQMQYFANARLELHPDHSDPRYRVELGLLSTEALLARGWLTSSQ